MSEQSPLDQFVSKLMRARAVLYDARAEPLSFIPGVPEHLLFSWEKGAGVRDALDELRDTLVYKNPLTFNWADGVAIARLQDATERIYVCVSGEDPKNEVPCQAFNVFQKNAKGVLRMIYTSTGASSKADAATQGDDSPRSSESDNGTKRMVTERGRPPASGNRTSQHELKGEAEEWVKRHGDLREKAAHETPSGSNFDEQTARIQEFLKQQTDNRTDGALTKPAQALLNAANHRGKKVPIVGDGGGIRTLRIKLENVVSSCSEWFIMSGRDLHFVPGCKNQRE